MKFPKPIPPIAGLLLTPLLLHISTTYAHEPKQTPQEVTVWGESANRNDASYVNPTSVLLPEDMVGINAVTTEDLVKFEPSLVIRRRFIGDSNGTMGIRGSNMFQTSRSMVFADGVPLHYLLESRWSGAPRWTMVSADEIARVEVLYGPFSAEYSGNAMGGVVLIETGIPQQREIHIEGSVFSQQFDAYGFDDRVNGFKGFASYGDKLGDFSYYLSYNHLDNDAQPQTFVSSTPTSTTAADTVDGGINGLDARLDEQGQTKSLMFFGDTGVVTTQASNYKTKFGYDFGDWQALLNVAFEDRESSNAPNTYIRDLNGNPVWAVTDAVQEAQQFSFNSQSLNIGLLDRQSLSLGLRVKGQLSEQINIEANLNQFEILKDETRSSALNPEDANFTGIGQIQDYEDSGWQTGDVKLTVDDWLTTGLQIISGIRHEEYELNLSVHDTDEYRTGIKGTLQSTFGGTTSTDAMFVQANWDINPQWDVAFGLRYESFTGEGGYYSRTNDAGNLEVVPAPRTEDNQLSPKFSLAYTTSRDWLLRYSIARAYRFPIVEELYRQYEKYNNINQANPQLKPENGLHHNFMLDVPIEGGYVRVNVFAETIKDAIESQSTTVGTDTINTFVPLDETQAKGVELIVNQVGLWSPQLDLRFNFTFTDATVEKNENNPEWEGNTYPRMPRWRSNVMTTYHVNPKWDLSATLQYASDSYGRIDNQDTVNHVYGAQDAYTRWGLKTHYNLTEQLSLSAGVDNLTNEISYVAHPWPGRTIYLNAAYDL